MPASLAHIHPGTPMGATLVADGATFRVWAPGAHSVHAIGDFNDRNRNDASLLNRDGHGHWLGFIPGVRDRDRYMFYVVGDGSEGPKRDPYARELQTPFPSDCIIRPTEPDAITSPPTEVISYRVAGKSAVSVASSTESRFRVVNGTSSCSSFRWIRNVPETSSLLISTDSGTIAIFGRRQIR